MKNRILPSIQHIRATFLKSIKPGPKTIGCALFFLAGVTVVKAQVPSTDINSYVLFAYDELHFKGRNGGDLTRGVIQGGNVGVNSCAIPNTKNLTFGGPVTMPTNGTLVVGYDVRVEPGSDIWELYANFVQTAFDPSVLRNGPFHSYTCPLISNLPSLPDINPGSVDVTVEKSQTLTLTPGQYGNVQIKDGGTLNLQTGLYQFLSMSSGKNVTIHTTDGTDVRVAGDMSYNNDAYVGPSNLAKFFIRSDYTSSNDATINFSRHTEFHGQVYAPNGRINLGDHTNLFGRFWAKSMSSDFNVSVYYAAPSPVDIPPEKRNVRSDIPEVYNGRVALFQTFPNPLSEATTIRYSLAKTENVILRIYNIAGKEVAILANEEQTAGIHSLQWNAAGNPEGMYIVELRAGSYVGTNKLVVLK